ncbi:hypothetical protein ALC62_11250 [Cyphomyrmex costatus]|uniref:Tc1-like transposase DDE domain-containing protein n=1 Tax=Cyphomyrmex costatus TaxID=456900 RepID=A0A195CAK7_9HYME|nr:hypothetical protein ALC62_11250 [Cyphomyrmex costatus]
MLSEAARTRRVARCNLLLCSLKNEASGRIRFFSDEEIFTVDAKINRRNDRRLAYMPLHFFKKREIVTKEMYLHVFQQDGAGFIRVIFSDNVNIFWSKKFWPLNSPDLNPLDYLHVWSVVERVTNKSRHPNVTSLRTAIEAAFVGMDSATLQRTCERFRPRIEAVIQANGGYIE